MVPTVELYKGNGQIDLESFVKNATWRELLVELVQKNKLDPWDIDISEVVDHYVSAVRAMKVLDLHIPANLILAASILLRFKSEMLVVNTAEIEEEDGQIQEQRVMPEVPPLVSKLRFQPGRKITLSELMEAMNEAMKIQQSHAQQRTKQQVPLNITINSDDIDAKMDKVYELVKTRVDKANVTTFNSIATEYKTSESIVIDLFVPLLMLMHYGKVELRQDIFFSEIFILLSDGKNA
ncbi:MAG: segregation/condensation protein A [Candidatus Micrarchaeia archaeon]